MVRLLNPMHQLVVLIDFLRVIHGAELRSAHRAEFRFFVIVVGQGLIVHGARGFRIERQGKLLFPVEFVAGIAQGVVAISRAGTMPGNIRSVSGDLVGDDAVFHVLFVGQAQMLFGRYVAEHGRAVPADHGRADGRGDVVVAGGDVGDQRPKRIERSRMAQLDFLIDLLFDLVERNVAGAFDHDLDVVLPGFGGQLAQGLQL